MNEAQLSKYERFFDRPTSLYNDAFYVPADVKMTPELEVLEQKAVAVLELDGFDTDKAREVVELHLHAATAVSQDCVSQRELMAKVREVTGYVEGSLSPGDAIRMAPFLNQVVPFDFNLKQWLVNVMKIDEDWERTRPALRWFELWQDEVPRSTVYDVILRLAETDGFNGTDEFAQYSSKLVDFFSSEPEKLQHIFELIGDSQKLPIFSELGSSSEYVEGLSCLLGEDRVDTHGVVRAVRHTDNYAGSCSSLDYTHRAALGAEHFDDDTVGSLTLIYAEDLLLGSIKMLKDMSFISFVTEDTQNGGTPLVRGGVYTPTKEVVQRAQEAYEVQGKWAKLTVDSLAIRPIRFIDYDLLGKPHGLLETLKVIDKVRTRYS